MTEKSKHTGRGEAAAGGSMSEIVTTLFGLFGGLAVFLFGMNQMSEALQKAAGEKMRTILGILTKNPLMGALAGALVTAVLQSSSATTVMVIGFVSAGLMGLPQAISVIFGANIGTTMTAQLIAFDIGEYIYPILFISFVVQFASKNEKIKNIAMVFFSFGLLFEGIQIMSSVMKPLAASPVFTELMWKVRDLPVLGVFLGLCMTLVVQSSSATIAVLQSFAAQAGPDGASVIGLAGAIPILLGDNIGTTITALLASIGQSRDAKRTAIAHTCFNISGTIVFSFFIPFFARFVQFVSPKGPEVEVISRQIANAHTTFNVVCTLIWLPLVPLMVKIVCHLVPDRAEHTASGVEEAKPRYLDLRMVSQPQAALILVSQEICRNLEDVRVLLSDLRRVLLSDSGISEKTEPDAASGQQKLLPEEYLRRCMNVQKVQESMISYISELFSRGSLTPEQSEQASGLLALIHCASRVADRCYDIVTKAGTLKTQGKAFSADATEELGKCFAAMERLYLQAIHLLGMGAGEAADPDVIAKAKRKLHKSIRQFNKAHLRRIESGKCTKDMTGVYSDILYNVDRIGDNCVGILEEALEHPKNLCTVEQAEEAAPVTNM